MTERRTLVPVSQIFPQTAAGVLRVHVEVAQGLANLGIVPEERQQQVGDNFVLAPLAGVVTHDFLMLAQPVGRQRMRW